MTSPRSWPRWWQWLTVLSLDAALVAVLWQWQVARVAGVALRAPQVFVLGVSVWLAYAADRWIEGWRLAPDRIRTQRHSFYQQNRWLVAVVWLGLFAADLGVALSALDRREFTGGLLLLGAVLVYLFSHQLVHRHHPWRAPKEICIALLLGGGVALFPVADLNPAAFPAVLGAQFLYGPLGLFLALCFVNCALISVWEEGVDQSHGQTSLVRQFRRWAVLIHALPWLLAGAAVLVASGAPPGPARTADFCAAGSSLLLATVDRQQPQTGRVLARVLADVALMTPVIPLVASWVK